ncbi:hypothetical protein ACWC2K_19365 [Streptomyces chattanoogensis]
MATMAIGTSTAIRKSIRVAPKRAPQLAYIPELTGIPGCCG